MINGIAPTADDGKVKLSITYEDENGKVSTVEKEIQLMVNEDQSMDESNVDDTWSSDDIQPEPSTTDKLKHLAIPVGIVLGLVPVSGTDLDPCETSEGSIGFHGRERDPAYGK